MASSDPGEPEIWFIFGNVLYYPSGGAADFRSTATSREEAEKAAREYITGAEYPDRLWAQFACWDGTTFTDVHTMFLLGDEMNVEEGGMNG